MAAGSGGSPRSASPKNMLDAPAPYPTRGRGAFFPQGNHLRTVPESRGRGFTTYSSSVGSRGETKDAGAVEGGSHGYS